MSVVHVQPLVPVLVLLSTTLAALLALRLLLPGGLPSLDLLARLILENGLVVPGNIAKASTRMTTFQVVVPAR